MLKVGIIGSGSWALAISRVLKNVQIIIKARNLEKATTSFSKEKKKLFITDNFSDLKDSQFIFLANPSQTVRENLNKLSFDSNAQFIICCKGVEKKTNKLMSEVVEDFFPEAHYAILSGPNFASEVIKGLPSASVLSSTRNVLLKEISKIIYQERFRIYFNNDVIGTQLGGAMKNVIAIANGIIIGCGFGHNAGAAIITRGLAEIIELGLKMGAQKNTFYGLSGLGDLTLTCSSLKSRNTMLGYLLAKGKEKTDQLFEGLESCQSICKLGKKFNVELPISNAVRKILDGSEINKIVNDMLSRPLQFEK
jgi:glycerol-3-phosphate dehydrogenase (NAD(P)+)